MAWPLSLKSSWTYSCVFFSPFKQDECKAGFDFNRNFLINPNAEWNIKPTEGLSLHQSSRSTRVSAGISETRDIKLLCAE